MKIEYDKLIKSEQVRDTIKHKVDNNIPFTQEEYESLTTGEVRYIIGNEDE